MNKRFLGFLMAFFIAVSVTDVSYATLGGKASVSFAQETSSGYKIVYKLNGGTNNKKNPATYKKTSKTITFKNPTRTGYSFDGWFRNKKLTKKITGIKKGSTGKVTVYAGWTPNRYTVRFDGNGAEGSMAALKNCIYDTEFTLPANSFTRSGMTFDGWNTKADGSGVAIKDKAIVKNLTAKNGGKVRLYAQWSYKMSIKDYGIIPNDGKDDTAALNKAILDASDEVGEGGNAVVTLKKGTYDLTIQDKTSTCAVLMRSNVTLKLAKGAVLKVKKVPVSQCCSVIGFFNVRNAKVIGGKIIGTGDIRTGDDCYGVWVKSSKNVTVQNMEITGNQCDGVYLSPQQVTDSYSIGNSGITITGCKIHDNCRSNISIVDADDVYIKNCNIYNSGERQPSCGICIEPNRHDASGDKICKNILISGTTIKTGRSGSTWNYRTFYTYDNTDSGYVVAENVRIANSNLIGYYGNYNGKNVIVTRDCKIDGSADGLVWGD